MAGVEGGLGLGLGLAGEPVEFGNHGEGVVSVLRVVHEDPFGEAEGLALAEADHGRLALVAYESQEPGGQVLGRTQFGGGQPDDDALVGEGRVAVDARGQVDGRRACAVGAAGQHGARLEQQFGVGRGVGRPCGAGGGGAHRASPPSSILRPAYSAAAIRMPSDQATGPTSVRRTARPFSSCQLRAPVLVSSS